MKSKIIKKVKRALGSKKRAKATGRKIAKSPATPIVGLTGFAAVGGHQIGKERGKKKMAQRAANDVVLLSTARQAKKRGYKLGKLSDKQLGISMMAAKKEHTSLSKKDIKKFHSQFKKK